MANKDLVSEEVLQELINKLEEIVNNYCHNLEYYTDNEVQDFFQADAQEITYYNGLINDTITSKNFLWSSKQIAEELAKSIIEANSYADNLVKNISSIKLKYVTSLPTSDMSENTIYILKASDGSSKDTLNLYNATDGWISIGEFDVSLDDYYTKTEIDTKMDLKANKTEVVANDKIVQTLDASTNSADTVLSTNGLQVEMDKKANDDEVIKKTDVKTTLDENSTNDDVYSGKAIFDAIKKNNKGVSYSTDEQLTGGTWIDGKPVYEKTVFSSFTNYKTGEETKFSIPLDNVNVVISIDGMANYDKPYPVPINYYIIKTSDTVQRLATYYSKTYKEIQTLLYSSTDGYANGNYFVTIRYTKTTD